MARPLPQNVAEAMDQGDTSALSLMGRKGSTIRWDNYHIRKTREQEAHQQLLEDMKQAEEDRGGDPKD